MSTVVSDNLKSTRLEKAAVGVLLLLTIAFPVLIFYVIPLFVIDLVAPHVATNYFTSV